MQQSMGSQRVGHGLATGQPQQTASNWELLRKTERKIPPGSVDSESAFLQASQVLFHPLKLKKHCFSVFTAPFRSSGQKAGPSL